MYLYLKKSILYRNHDRRLKLNLGIRIADNQQSNLDSDFDSTTSIRFGTLIALAYTQVTLISIGGGGGEGISSRDF